MIKEYRWWGGKMPVLRYKYKFDQRQDDCGSREWLELAQHQKWCLLFFWLSMHPASRFSNWLVSNNIHLECSSKYRLDNLLASGPQLLCQLFVSRIRTWFSQFTKRLKITSRILDSLLRNDRARSSKERGDRPVNGIEGSVQLRYRCDLKFCRKNE